MNIGRATIKAVLTAAAVAILGVTLITRASPARADGSFGTVTLTQSGTSVNFDVVLIDGYRFQETADGGGELFLFNDSLSGSTITNISATLNGATFVVSGGLSGFTKLSPVSTGSDGTFTASVECTVAANCDGASTPTFNDLHFTVTNATVAQLEVANEAGNIFSADVLPPGTAPEPATLALLGIGLVGVGFSRRARKQ